MPKTYKGWTIEPMNRSGWIVATKFVMDTEGEYLKTLKADDMAGIKEIIRAFERGEVG